jgi:hypothetical protein
MHFTTWRAFAVLVVAGILGCPGSSFAKDFTFSETANAQMARRLNIPVFFAVPPSAYATIPGIFDTTDRLIDFKHPAAQKATGHGLRLIVSIRAGLSPRLAKSGLVQTGNILLTFRPEGGWSRSLHQSPNGRQPHGARLCPRRQGPASRCAIDRGVSGTTAARRTDRPALSNAPVHPCGPAAPAKRHPAREHCNLGEPSSDDGPPDLSSPAPVQSGLQHTKIQTGCTQRVCCHVRPDPSRAETNRRSRHVLLGVRLGALEQFVRSLALFSICTSLTRATKITVLAEPDKNNTYINTLRCGGRPPSGSISARDRSTNAGTLRHGLRA